jgi:hypothetical protein
VGGGCALGPVGLQVSTAARLPSSLVQGSERHDDDAVVRGRGGGAKKLPKPTNERDRSQTAAFRPRLAAPTLLIPFGNLVPMHQPGISVSFAVRPTKQTPASTRIGVASPRRPLHTPVTQRPRNDPLHRKYLTASSDLHLFHTATHSGMTNASATIGRTDTSCGRCCSSSDLTRPGEGMARCSAPSEIQVERCLMAGRQIPKRRCSSQGVDEAINNLYHRVDAKKSGPPSAHFGAARVMNAVTRDPSYSKVSDGYIGQARICQLESAPSTLCPSRVPALAHF